MSFFFFSLIFGLFKRPVGLVEMRFKMMVPGGIVLLRAPMRHKFHDLGHPRFQDFWRSWVII